MRRWTEECGLPVKIESTTALSPAVRKKLDELYRDIFSDARRKGEDHQHEVILFEFSFAGPGHDPIRQLAGLTGTRMLVYDRALERRHEQLRKGSMR